MTDSPRGPTLSSLQQALHCDHGRSRRGALRLAAPSRPARVLSPVVRRPLGGEGGRKGAVLRGPE
eukprot:5847798-Alexandrium_andersonii.AAC.1